jgi:hypothetical protein
VLLLAMLSSKLPSRICYLQPVLEQLDKVPASSLNEDTDVSLLESLIQRRIEGLPTDKAKQILRTDWKALGKWLTRSEVNRPSAHFILGWLTGSRFFDSENLVESISDLLSDLPSPPPSRQFGPLPEIELAHNTLLDEKGNVYIYIRSGAFEPNPIDLRVTIDGILGVLDVFEWNPNVFTRYRLLIAEGHHNLVAESKRGQARLEEDINVEDTLHVGITYWHRMPYCLGPGLPPTLTLHAAKEPWIPDYGWILKH